VKGFFLSPSTTSTGGENAGIRCQKNRSTTSKKSEHRGDHDAPEISPSVGGAKTQINAMWISCSPRKERLIARNITRPAREHSSPVWPPTGGQAGFVNGAKFMTALIFSSRIGRKAFSGITASKASHGRFALSRTRTIHLALSSSIDIRRAATSASSVSLIKCLRLPQEPVCQDDDYRARSSMGII